MSCFIDKGFKAHVDVCQELMLHFEVDYSDSQNCFIYDH